MHPEFVQAFMDGICDRPGKQKMCLAVLGQVEEWAIVRRHLPMQITLGVKIGRSHGGHIPWTAEQVALAEQHAEPMLARAVTLAANTGQRGSDLVRMGWSDIEEYEGIRGINVLQKKTKTRVWIPITEELSAAMATWERTTGPFLRRPDGFWTRAKLSEEWSNERDHNPGLAPLRLANLKLEEGVDPGRDKGLVLHGLRGFACVRLHRAGLTAEQIGDLVGMSAEVVKTYTRYAAQKDNAIAAMQQVDRTFAERLSRKIAQSKSDK
jgi:integrase